MAEPPFGAQATFLLHHLVQQFVGVQAALHQHLGLAGAHHRHGHLGGVVAVIGRHQPVRRDVDARFSRDGANFPLRADQDRRDQAILRRLDSSLQCVVAARMNHRRGRGRQAAARFDQLAIPVGAP